MTVMLPAPLLTRLKEREGGAKYTNRPADRGGPTKYGVTARTLGAARRLGRDATEAEVQALTEAEADQIYSALYWEAPGYCWVQPHSERLAEELFDQGVNLGTGRPAKWLQRSLNLCNRRGRDFPDVRVDGVITQSGETVRAIAALVRVRGAAGITLLLRCIDGLQFMEYVAITERGGVNNDQEENFCGWVLQRIGGY